MVIDVETYLVTEHIPKDSYGVVYVWNLGYCTEGGETKNLPSNELRHVIIAALGGEDIN
jgi:hypothetical protein